MCGGGDRWDNGPLSFIGREAEEKHKMCLLDIFSLFGNSTGCVFYQSKISATICSLDVVVAEMFLKLLHELTRSNVSWQVFQSFVCDQCMLIKLKPARM